MALVAQLAMMSILDTQRAETAAHDVASSRFTTGLIDDTVRSAVSPVLDRELTDQVVAVATSEPRVRDVVARSLIDAHRQLVDPSAQPLSGSVDSSTAAGSEVDAAIESVLAEAGRRAGVDLTGVADQVRTPGVSPERLPGLALRPVAETARLTAAALALATAILTIAIHPRRGRAVSGLGWKAAAVCLTWFLGMLVAGWMIGRVADTLFGELLSSLWADASPAMVTLLLAGALLGGGAWLGGIALDGLVRPAVDPTFRRPRQRVVMTRTVPDERFTHVDPVPNGRRVHRDRA